MEWNVRIEVACAVELDERRLDERHEPRIDDFMDLLDEWGGIPSWSPNSYAARLTVETDGEPDNGDSDARMALGLALEHFRETAMKAELPDWPVIGLEVRPQADLEAELEQPNFPDIVGSAEAAAELGVSRQRLAQLIADKPEFPAPIVRFAATPVWMRAAIQRFAEDWERTPGRPRKSLQET